MPQATLDMDGKKLSDIWLRLAHTHKTCRATWASTNSKCRCNYHPRVPRNMYVMIRCSLFNWHTCLWMLQTFSPPTKNWSRLGARRQSGNRWVLEEQQIRIIGTLAKKVDGLCLPTRSTRRTTHAQCSSAWRDAQIAPNSSLVAQVHSCTGASMFFLAHSNRARFPAGSFCASVSHGSSLHVETRFL